MALAMQIGEVEKSSQDLAAIGLKGISLLDPLSSFDPYGAWRLDIATGLTYWTRDVYLIHGMSPTAGPVDLVSAVNAYHPEDRELVMQCVEEAIANKSGFRFVLRLLPTDGPQVLVKSTGVFRTTANGDELYGTFSQFQAPVRSVAIE
ncbi:PAS domain-containing protein [Ahrensia sp. 13_GOM-1096m]|uniref:PAS domain-containing protein n=1 Tax=Ahrensia sp. 13_GOM-1096m TaxID=1380380 RepID=UPI00047E744C|nr:PAS domain-containing protein [Ahrensia sp. 13_GOM-1096m]